MLALSLWAPHSAQLTVSLCSRPRAASCSSAPRVSVFQSAVDACAHVYVWSVLCVRAHTYSEGWGEGDLGAQVICTSGGSPTVQLSLSLTLKGVGMDRCPQDMAAVVLNHWPCVELSPHSRSGSPPSFQTFRCLIQPFPLSSGQVDRNSEKTQWTF